MKKNALFIIIALYACPAFAMEKSERRITSEDLKHLIAILEQVASPRLWDSMPRSISPIMSSNKLNTSGDSIVSSDMQFRRTPPGSTRTLKWNNLAFGKPNFKIQTIEKPNFEAPEVAQCYELLPRCVVLGQLVTQQN
jgi:hypothetical protein